LSSERFYLRLVELPDGRVLFVGGALTGTAESRAEVDAYDPKTSNVTPFASLRVPRSHPGVAALADGRVVVIGGYAGEDGSLDTIEVYEPSKKAFRVLPVRLEVPTAELFAIPMKDGRVLIGGGEASPRGNAPGKDKWPRSSFILDPTTGKLTRTGDTPWPLSDGGFYTVAESGVITVTGEGEKDPVKGTVLRDCTTTFDPASKTWTDTKRCTQPSDHQGRIFHTANGAASNAGFLVPFGLELYRNGTWEKELNPKGAATGTGLSLDEGLSLDAHHVIAVDGQTYQVMRCSF